MYCVNDMSVGGLGGCTGLEALVHLPGWFRARVWHVGFAWTSGRIRS